MVVLVVVFRRIKGGAIEDGEGDAIFVDLHIVDIVNDLFGNRSFFFIGDVDRWRVPLSSIDEGSSFVDGIDVFDKVLQ